MYPDPSKPYLFTDNWKYCWGVPFLSSLKIILDNLKAITFTSGKFSGTQQNQAILVREASSIYISIKRPNFHLQDAKNTILCNHRIKITNEQLAIELSSYKLKIHYIKGMKNDLANCLTRLVDANLTDLYYETDGQVFGHTLFEDLPPYQTHRILQRWIP